MSARHAGSPDRIDRRLFLLGAAGFGSALVARAAGGQDATQNFAPMEQGAYRPTLRPDKPGATPKLTDDQRDALEHRIKCQCGCILDVYTCRTTDFTCQVSPAMHRDVLRLIAGGYDGDEILAAFVETYGEVAMTEPKKEGFNWAGYFAPSVALATGAVLLTVLVRKWTAESRVAAAARASVPGAAIPGMSDEDRARLDRALREDA
ncbi:MAG: cytochrome c-type biogenesis protein CcmH [Gemmatimonadetes bacterium]|nr:cytochrome c-type biogenesis protein CcmH [Gemmatimonadota bacterium]MBP7549144.1 cytochrome c-type biogenesis protein CcmH [Gemmatimonadaceae bacterium]